MEDLLQALSFSVMLASLHFEVPLGTLVKEDGKVVADLTQHGEEYIAAYGGAGGKGNRFFLSNENRAPAVFTPGEPGQERLLHLELKTTAHAGLVSFCWFSFHLVVG